MDFREKTIVDNSTEISIPQEGSIVKKFLSRTLLAFLVATGLLCFDKVSEDNWMYICIAYIGSTKAKDFALQWKNKV